MGVEFYRKAFSLIREILKDYKFSIAIQTNGLLLSQKWISLFEEWNVQLGLSWDGPPEINDAQRVTRSGGGTSTKIVEAAEMIRRSSLPLNVICVLTQRSMRSPKKLFEYFEEQEVVSLSFNMEEIEGTNTESTVFEAGLKRGNFRQFLREYFQLCLDNGSQQDLREFVTGMSFFLSEDHSRSNLEIYPGNILTIGVNGSISTYSPELHGARINASEKFIIANILNDEDWMNSMQLSPLLARVDREIQDGIQRCKEVCSYFEVCRGGSPSNKFGEHGRFDSAETVSCTFYVKAVSDATLDVIRLASMDELRPRIGDHTRFDYSA